MPKKILADTGFWFALFNEKKYDNYRTEARIIEEDKIFKFISPKQNRKLKLEKLKLKI